MIAIVDYGVGNLFSLKSSFAAVGAEAVVTADDGNLPVAIGNQGIDGPAGRFPVVGGNTGQI